MANAKGSMLINFKEYVISQHGEESWQRLIGFLTDQERRTLSIELRSDKWYPMPLIKRLIGAFDNLYGRGEFKSIIPIAEHIADNDIVPFLEKLKNLQTPSGVLRNTPSLWRRYFDSGEMRIDVADDEGKRYRFSLEGFENVSGEVFCIHLISAWLGRILPMAGAKGLEIVHTALQEMNGPPLSLEVRWS